MATRETQNLIISTAIELFNENGTRTVSTNKIADQCGVSRGNLHYHFRTKQEVIQTIFRRIVREMEDSWYEDHRHPTLKHLKFIFERQIDLVWRYRFFYREVNALLADDHELKELFIQCRRKRIVEVRKFFECLITVGLIQDPGPEVPLDSLLRVAWLVTDQWMPNLDMYSRVVNEKSLEEGFELVVQVFLPYFTPEARQSYFQITGESQAENPEQR
jgi:AcrR family transcriptional regulator